MSVWSRVQGAIDARRGIVYAGSPRRGPRLAVTFDDGPSQWTRQVAEALGRVSGRGTFFVLGEHVGGHEGLLRELVREGHEIAVHGLRHTPAHTLPERTLLEELAETMRRVEAACGVTPRLYRPPHGGRDHRVAQVAARAGLAPTVLMTVAPKDWSETDPQVIVDHVLQRAAPGGIVCLHDGIWAGSPGTDSRDATVAAVTALGPQLDARGLALVTVSELLT